MLDLHGKGALVVGARRIGAEVVRRLAAAGVRCAIGYRSDLAAAERVAAQVERGGERVPLLQADISRDDEAARLVQDARAALGNLSFVVNLASGFEAVALDDLDEAAWDRGLADARASYLLSVHASRILRRNDGPTRGHILLFSDWAVPASPYAGHLPYLTAKAAIDFMARAFAVELAPHGILVNAIAPGRTERPPHVPVDRWQAQVDESPLRRAASSREIAEVVSTLLRSETITGTTSVVDSGRRLAGG